MTDWVAVSVDIHDDPKIAAFAKALGVTYDAAAMRLVQVWGRLARHDNEQGQVGEVDDETLEAWAGWRGKAGRFAPEYRRRFTEDGIVNGWWEWNGRHLRKARLDRERSAERRKNIGGESADSPQTVVRDSTGNTGTVPNQKIPPHRAMPEGFAGLLNRLPDTGGARVAVTEFLERVPDGTEDGWVSLLNCCLDGLDMPQGRPCTPEQLATVCRDFGTKQLGDWTARFFRVCLKTEMRQGVGGKSLSEAIDEDDAFSRTLR